ncbi:MAG: dipicolinate synthase subunit [Oscillospiraceae bacterium]|nr:dipicolinate synthase subunit [Oscillospiraceae bacterium]
MEKLRVGYAFCGSFCTYDRAIRAMECLKPMAQELIPIVSETVADTDTRFGAAHNFLREIERICDRRVIQTIVAAEPIGPEKMLDVLVIAPCTGNTLAKLAFGVTDTSVTMAAKAHRRNGGPVVVAISTNDGLGPSLKNIGELLNRKGYYFVPFRQDDPMKKPTSLVSDFDLIPATIEAAWEGQQLQPLLLQS